MNIEISSDSITGCHLRVSQSGTWSRYQIMSFSNFDTQRNTLCCLFHCAATSKVENDEYYNVYVITVYGRSI